MSREKNEKEASEVLSDFLKFVRRCEDDYQAAREAVGVEDKRLQDLLHEMEFADGEKCKAPGLPLSFSKAAGNAAGRKMRYRDWSRL